MKKKIILILTIFLGIFIALIAIITTYIIIGTIDEQNKISKLEKYTRLENEITLKEFNYNNKKYIISSYYDDTSSWSHLNILLNFKDNYYRLEEIKKCDSPNDENILIKNNKIYIHCIGKKGDILEYEIKETTINKNIMYLNYDKTPNISQPHILIDKIDNKYIYLYSNVKINDSIKEGERVKCSLINSLCNYY